MNTSNPQAGHLNALTTRQTRTLFGLIITTLFPAAVACASGSFDISLWALLKGNASALEQSVFNQIRVPRVLLSGLVGASLGLSGAALQGLFRNPLADPGLIAVSAGAALGAALIIVLGSQFAVGATLGAFLLPVAAISGAALVILLLYIMTRGFGYQGVTYMLLVGIAVNALASVGIGVLTYISDDAELRSLTFWSMGSFGGATWPLLVPALLAITVALLMMAPAARALDLLQLGEVEASRLGVDIVRLRYRVIFSAAAAVGASVSLSGMIGFVGLIVPHLVRLIGGVNHRYLLPGSALAGAGLLISAGLLARTLIQPAELPVGLITSAVGSPFFLWLIFRMQKL